MRHSIIGLCLLFFHLAALGAPSVEKFTQGFESRSGFLNLFLDHKEGKTYIEIPNDLGELIYQESLARGIGSNDIGLDRGRLGETQLVEFLRVGNKVLLQAKNTDFRAGSDNKPEQLAVEEAFATSVLWGFKVVAVGDSSYLIDYTDFLLSDSFGIGAVLKEQEQGDFKLSSERSVMHFPLTKSFPKNTELEGLLTLVGNSAGKELRAVTPNKTAVTVHVHHSLIALPEAGYKMREYLPESGYFPMSYADFSAPVEADLVQRFIHRHRLEKQNPNAEKSKAKTPIVYYMDPAVPEPVRSALFEGATWWNQAFEAAGYVDAFQVKYLPEGADPMDVRYNVIQWVHRRTRGWSYGMSVRDPRTGEILKGKVTLGSLRIRQDILIAQGLLSPFKSGISDEVATEELKALALARIRQLSAHEIGHTLGLVHNFSASTYGGEFERGSVMDYPHPMLRLKKDQIDLSQAYAVGIGPWDKHAITYGYAEVPGIKESEFLQQLIQEARIKGMSLMTDADARAPGGGHPAAHLWDSDEDIVAGLDNTIRVRGVALSGLGEDSLRQGQPYSELERVLVPVYFLHRYQAEAVTKLIGGASYDYRVKGQGIKPVEPVAASKQREALWMLLSTLRPEFLSLPPNLSALVPPAAAGYKRSRENAPSQTSPYFDPVTLAEAAAEETLKFLLNPQRLARVAQQETIRDQLSLQELLDDLLEVGLASKKAKGIEIEISKRVRFLMIEHLLDITWGDQHVPEVQAIAHGQLRKIERSFERDNDNFNQYLVGLIKRAEVKGEYSRRGNTAKIPPGSPI
tara:strand:+ start:35677 stop:38073 length:2397 start_codon:yes stop_codon:yes gene_type:complete